MSTEDCMDNEVVSQEEDIEGDVDGCDVPIETITLDEELPPSEGGVE